MAKEHGDDHGAEILVPPPIKDWPIGPLISRKFVIEFEFAKNEKKRVEGNSGEFNYREGIVELSGGIIS